MATIYIKSESLIEESGETMRADYEQAFMNVLIEHLLNVLHINYGDRNVVKALFHSSLDKLITQREGLLEQYLHSQLDIIKERFIKELKLSEDIKTNYDYATHAKFADLLDAIKNKYEKKRKNARTSS